MSSLSCPEGSSIVIDDLDPLVDDYVILGGALLLSAPHSSELFSSFMDEIHHETGQGCMILSHLFEKVSPDLLLEGLSG